MQKMNARSKQKKNGKQARSRRGHLVVPRALFFLFFFGLLLPSSFVA